MKNKKGFTLIELLAVIVILAIIALIAIPIIMNMIYNARKGAAEDAAYGYIDAIEYSIGFKDMGLSSYSDVTLFDDTSRENYNVDEINESHIKIKGKKPTSGSVKMSARKVTYADLCIDGFRVIYENKKATAHKDGTCASGSNPVQITYREFDKYEVVKFDPVKYEFCDKDPSSETCYDWAIVSKSGNVYDLLLLNALDSSKWPSGTKNPVDAIKDSTTTWSNKLTIESKWDITVDSNYGYKFSEAKGRLITKKELDDDSVLTDIMKLSCQNTSSACVVLDTEENFFYGLHIASMYKTMPFSANATGGTHIGYYLKPVIHLDLTKNVGNAAAEESTGNKVYKPGDVVYYDPVNASSICDSSHYSVDNIKNNGATCYRWRVIEAHDDATKKEVNLQLDHAVALADYISTSSVTDSMKESYLYGEIGPVTILGALNGFTGGWTRLPLLTYNYDVSNIGNPPGDKDGKNYGSLSCYKGDCKTQVYNSKIPGIRGRVITAEEVAEIGKTNPTELVATNNNFPSIKDWTRQATNNEYYFSHRSKLEGQNTDLKWLVEHTDYDEYGSGATYGNTQPPVNANYYGYWTLTPSTYAYSFAWIVNYDGKLYAYTIYNTYNHFAIRPVVTVPKADLK